MRWLSLYRVDFFKCDDVPSVEMSGVAYVQNLTHETAEMVLSLRPSEIKDRLLEYIESGKEGALYCDDGTCLAHALLWRDEETAGRRLFGYLTIPKGVDFIFFFKSKESVITQTFQTIAAYFYRQHVPIGISAPRQDLILQTAIRDSGFKHTHSLLSIALLKFKFAVRWPKGW